MPSGLPSSTPHRVALANEQAPAPVIPRTYDSIDDESTPIQLSPTFLLALKALNPKKRRMKFRHVLGLGVIVVLTVLGADRSTRAFAIEKGQALVAKGKLVAYGAPPQGPSLTSAQTPVKSVAPAAPAAVDDKAAGPAGQRFDELVVPAPSASSKNSRAAPQKGTGVRGPRSALRSPSRDGLVVARIPSSI